MDIIKRAMLGDKKAQEEITARGELLPCPFCGSIEEEMRGLRCHVKWIQCKGCLVEGETADTEQEAIELWNFRTQLLTEEEMERLEREE